MSGRPLTTKCPYGYVKDPDDKDKWLVDEEAADVVRRIFSLAIDGMSTYQIAEELRNAKTDIPTVHLAKRGQGVSNLTRFPDPYIWSSSTIQGILNRREYLGNTINFKTTKHFKDKNSYYLPEEDWKEFENTHPAIIDRETFEKAQECRNRKDPDAAADPHPLTGIVICADCGARMYSAMGRPGKKKGPEYKFLCSAYMKRPAGTYCRTSHCVTIATIEAAIREKLEWLKNVAAEKGMDVFDELYAAQGETGCMAPNDLLQEAMKELKEQKEKNKNLLDSLSRDHAAGIIPTEQYKFLSARYEEKLASVNELIEKHEMSVEQNAGDSSAEMFLDYLKRYHTGDEINYSTLCGFLDRIVVHEREEKYSRKCDQEIEVFFK